MPNREQLAEQYAQASAAARHLIQLSALCHEAINRAELVELSNKSDWRDQNQSCLVHAKVRPVLDELVTRGLLVNAHRKQVSAAHDIQDLAIQDTIRAGQFENYARVIQKKLPLSNDRFYYSYRPYHVVRELRDLRIAFYRGDVKTFQSLLNPSPYSTYRLDWSHLTFLDPFDSKIFDGLKPFFQQLYLTDLIHGAILRARGSATALEVVEPYVATSKNIDATLSTAWLDLSVARGDLPALRRMAEQSGDEFSEAAGCEAFLKGDVERAEMCFEAVAKRVRVETKRRNVALEHFPGLLHVLILLRQNSPAARKQARSIIKTASETWSSDYAALLAMLKGAFAFQESPLGPDRPFRGKLSGQGPFTQWMAGLLWRWMLPEEQSPFYVVDLRAAAGSYEAAGLSWLAAEAFGLVGRCDERIVDTPTSKHQSLHAATGSVCLLEWMRAEAPWERSLSALAQLGGGGKSSAPDTGSESRERMIWVVAYNVKVGIFEVRPVIQKRTKRGGWTSGRDVALKRLHDNLSQPEFDFLTDKDRDVCRCIKENVYDSWGRYRDVEYGFDSNKVARALAGHPLVFSSRDRELPLEIVVREPQLVIAKAENNQVRLSIEPRPTATAVTLVEDGPQRLAVVAFTDGQRKVDAILGGELTVPESASQRVLETIQSISSLMTIHSEIGGTSQIGETVDSNPCPHLHLVPFQEGLRAEFFVRPFGEAGPFYRPGQGGETVFADVNGKSMAARRVLSDEQRRMQDVVAACPSLAAQNDADLCQFCFPFAIEALELVLQLQPLVDAGQLILHWPQGRSFRVAGEVKPSQFQVRIRKDHDWFAASGELQVDESLSLDMMKLIELVEASPSRFIRLDDGQFLALTDQLRRRIEDLTTFGQRRKDSVRFPAIRAAALDDLGDAVTLKADKHWTDYVQRMRAAGDLTPEIPSTLQTDLRDYQCDGFRWLGRLAHWGVGGCLADDMGLGKTIQALALLLDRAAGGAALVVCPTSVGFNWVNECQRFAPTLNTRLFGAGDREAFLKEVGPRDVVICSYGLLYNEAERFQAVPWHTVILDEAQAIKNMQTKRSQTVMGLQADFRLIMTGTPLENHLGELWNLFNFINPGLLGSFESFQTVFAGPIERDESRDTQRRLKKLIQPFILRRTKSQVLDELPSRTEITLQVELSKEEAAFYDALRHRAIQKLSDADLDGKPQHLKILAEIMRLRRACCHSKLVMPESPVSSSKLALFSDTIDELLENRHKVLVFSQFVDHLTILREELDRKKVAYQYLDGGTPARERQKRVEAFQAGQGDVFLISLRAGGQGLNLTAADYVLHMDPWWNPAVEDQASDRAHRIGQKRPVTIYRFVTTGTIEERIVEMHRTKRDLADTLLEGADMSGKLSAEELLRLLKE